MDFSKVAKITIPEGNVNVISLDGVNLWKENNIEDVEITDDWDVILASIEDGTYQTKYKLGNYKPLDLGDEGIVNMQIVAFDTDFLANGSGKAPITWISKDCLARERRMNPDNSRDNGGTFHRINETNTWTSVNQMVGNTVCTSTWIITANAAGTLTITSTADTEGANYDYLTVSVDDEVIVKQLGGRGASDVWSMECAEGQTVKVAASYVKDNFMSEGSDCGTITFDATMDITIAASEEKPLQLTLGTNAAGGWEYSELRQWFEDTLIELLPENIKSHLSTISKTCITLDANGEISYSGHTSDKLWIPSFRELYGDVPYSESDGPIYKNTEIQKKIGKMIWLRSVYYNGNFINCYFRVINENGGTGGSTAHTTQDRNVLIGFCLDRERFDQYRPEERPNDCLLFAGERNFSLSASKKWEGIVEYSMDKKNWYEWDGKEIESSKGRLYLRGKNTVKFSEANFSLSSKAGCYGNIMTLLDYESPNEATLADNCFRQLFRDCTNLIAAPELPATALAKECYRDMFRGCLSLKSAPELPATTLAGSCYRYMFEGCTNLTTAPELPATTLAGSCYNSMFRGCLSLKSAPELPATTLATSCYQYMFYDCRKLTAAPELPAIALASFCYHCMFHGCTNLTTAPELPATTLADSCYDSMFYNCTNLTTAPELPATTLANYCYAYMFDRCTNLKLSATQDATYRTPYRIPTTGDGVSASSALTGMFDRTGGTFTGTPEINTTYYLAVPTEQEVSNV